ncbi:hypothetical protein MAM1_0034c02564 [Mucor ambiguus]|uniref:Uncharacterized protein n=1 Tax=Mucor ambiguus TaxID=91626 RepID=A0A0C9MMF8_9FUNG|nr:hypothetical protein MAM1_0034c02564 [Mucor ambiguus]
MITEAEEKDFDSSTIVGFNEEIVVNGHDLASSKDDTLQQNSIEAGHISKIPFFTWTLVAVIGIITCLLHANQASIWQWTGITTTSAQSLEAKIVISIFSTIIGGCVVALLSKTIAAVSFALLRYRGASFPHLVTLIGGYTTARIPILAAGGGYISGSLILLILVTSVVTKQLAVVSMGTNAIELKDSGTAYIRNYSDCEVPEDIYSISTMYTSVLAQTFSGILNPNSTYTSEYYDRAIPPTLKGFSQFERVLPYSEASCEVFNSNIDYYNFGTPYSYTMNATWKASFVIPYDSSVNNSWAQCNVSSGIANAMSNCNNTGCLTDRTSEITPFENNAGHILSWMWSLFFSVYQPQSSVDNNLIVSWLLGGDVLRNHYSRKTEPRHVPIDYIASRVATLGTVMTRVICDQSPTRKSNVPYSPANYTYVTDSYYQYQVLWKWPFYLLAGGIALLWLVCVIAMWRAPESRIISVEWLFSQYLSKNQLAYQSGRQLALAYSGTKYQIIDDNANGQIGTIVIAKVGTTKFAKYKRVRHSKQYY